jgi:aconitate hydratase
VDFDREPLGLDPNGNPVYLRDVWPSQEEVNKAVEEALDPELFKEPISPLQPWIFIITTSGRMDIP